jgi:hypothetical protein
MSFDFQRWCSATVVLIIFLWGTAGCSKSDGTRVTGHLTYKANPVAGASLIFYPVSGRSVSAVVDADGNYVANLPSGDYTATVNLSVELPPGWKEGQPIPPQKVILPTQYTKRTQSPLKASVAAGSSQTIDFDLK